MSMLSPREIRYSLEKTRIILLSNANMCKASHATIPDSSVEPVGSKIFEPGPDGLYFSGQRISKYPSRNTNLTNIDGVILYSIKILIMAVQIKK